MEKQKGEMDVGIKEFYCHGHRTNLVLSCDWYDTDYCEHTCIYARKQDLENGYRAMTGLERFQLKQQHAQQMGMSWYKSLEGKI